MLVPFSTVVRERFLGDPTFSQGLRDEIHKLLDTHEDRLAQSMLTMLVDNGVEREALLDAIRNTALYTDLIAMAERDVHSRCIYRLTKLGHPISYIAAILELPLVFVEATVRDQAAVP